MPGGAAGGAGSCSSAAADALRFGSVSQGAVSAWAGPPRRCWEGDGGAPNARRPLGRGWRMVRQTPDGCHVPTLGAGRASKGPSGAQSGEWRGSMWQSRATISGSTSFWHRRHLRPSETTMRCLPKHLGHASPLRSVRLFYGAEGLFRHPHWAPRTSLASFTRPLRA